ncbi:hypothetical protein HG263_01555 [Pseudoalteromonas sp. JBTF-M23]|uniref:Uncharacterized protein n=1 Tax=Pseudoalteromonas caenipelagi TaxID=2726988 RepID=A0A849V6T4_9GAMM|nr:hypothetical protein [Pseudoalteromonas caenipelagi]NOU49239.1 hypothetical protein [Pseudoalteromonas caenipelagi]
MKIKLNKKTIKTLKQPPKEQLDDKATRQIAGGGFTSEWFKELSRMYC